MLTYKTSLNAKLSTRKDHQLILHVCVYEIDCQSLQLDI